MLRRVRHEVLSQLPPRTDTRVPVTFTEAQAEEHDALKQPIADLMNRAKKRPLTQAEFLRLMQLLTQQRIICNGLALLQFGELWPTFAPSDPTPGLLRRLDSPKLVELREMVDQLAVQQRRKVVVFSQWRRMLQLAQWVTKDLLAAAGARGAFFSGQESQKRRAHNIVDFHDDPGMRVLFCSDAGGVGLNLQHAASCLINLDLPWNPAVLEQRIGRIHRLGQQRPIQVYHLISEYGIEARIEGVIGVKKALFDGLFDGTSDAVEFDRSASFLDQLQRVVEPAEVPEELLRAPGATPAEQEDELDADDEELVAADVDLDAIAAEPSASVESDAAPSAEPAAGLISPSQVQQLLTRLEVTRKLDGGVTIDAPPEAAEALAAMFAGVADLISKAQEIESDAVRR